MLRSRPFLMFTGQAEQALALYAEAFADFRLLALRRHGEGGPGVAGTVHQATFVLGGTSYQCLDSPAVHDFSFTPAVSVFVEFDSREHFDRAVRALGEGGTWLMPVGDYEFSNHYGWVQDRFGVSWQLNLGAMPDPS